jgi:hypothetical protein
MPTTPASTRPAASGSGRGAAAAASTTPRLQPRSQGRQGLHCPHGQTQRRASSTHSSPRSIISSFSVFFAWIGLLCSESIKCVVTLSVEFHASECEPDHITYSFRKIGAAR